MSEIKEKILKVKEQKDTYIIPQNIKKDVKILGVTGTYEGSSGVKLFETQEAMQADENPQEGDLAVVYRNDIQSLTATAHFLKATFPETVVLNETLEDYVDLRFRTVDSSSWFDCWGMIDQNMFEMSCYGEQGQYRIQYESQDGLTYTRTRLQDPNGDVTGNELDFGVELYYEREEYWNDVIGKFILIGGNTFEGLFKYSQSTELDKYRLYGMTNIIASGEQITYDKGYLDISKSLLNKLPEMYEFYCKSQELSGSYMATNVITYDDFTFYIYTFNNDLDNIIIRFNWPGRIPQIMTTGNNKLRLSTIYRNVSSSTSVTLTDDDKPGYYYVIYNLKTNQYSISNIQLDLNTHNKLQVSTWTDMYFSSTDFVETINYLTCMRYYKGEIDNNISDNVSSIDLYYIDGSEWGTKLDSITLRGSNFGGDTFLYEIFYAYKYLYTDTQLTLNNPNQLLPGMKGYGNNGVVEGDESIYNNLDPEVILTKYYGLQKLNLSEYPDRDQAYDSYYENIYGKNRDCISNITDNVMHHLKEDLSGGIYLINTSFKKLKSNEGDWDETIYGEYNNMYITGWPYAYGTSSYIYLRDKNTGETLYTITPPTGAKENYGIITIRDNFLYLALPGRNSVASDGGSKVSHFMKVNLDTFESTIIDTVALGSTYTKYYYDYDLGSNDFNKITSGIAGIWTSGYTSSNASACLFKMIDCNLDNIIEFSSVEKTFTVKTCDTLNSIYIFIKYSDKISEIYEYNKITGVKTKLCTYNELSTDIFSCGYIFDGSYAFVLNNYLYQAVVTSSGSNGNFIKINLSNGVIEERGTNLRIDDTLINAGQNTYIYRDKNFNPIFSKYDRNWITHIVFDRFDGNTACFRTTENSWDIPINLLNRLDIKYMDSDMRFSSLKTSWMSYKNDTFEFPVWSNSNPEPLIIRRYHNSDISDRDLTVLNTYIEKPNYSDIVENTIIL